MTYFADEKHTLTSLFGEREPEPADMPTQTMSSREIADLCGKRHDHVMRDIRAMLSELYDEKDHPKFGGVYRGGNGESRPCFRLPKRESLILVSGYNLTMRARIIDRWQELEEKVADPIAALNDPSTMRGLLLSYSEKVLALEEANAAMAPKAEALDRIATAEGSLCVTDAAKTLQVRPKALFDFLRAHSWIYSRPGTPNIAYQAKLQQGLLEHKTTTVYRSDGSEKVTTQVRVTPKGLTRLAKEFPPAAQAA